MREFELLPLDMELCWLPIAQPHYKISEVTALLRIAIGDAASENNFHKQFK